MLTPYHIEIMLDSLGGCFSPRAMAAIISANINQDRLAGQFGHDEFHFDNNAFEKSYAYMEEQRARTISSLQKKDVLWAWSAFGRMTHTAQDFYAHSNYITLWVSRYEGGTLPPLPDIDPVDPSLLHSPDLRSWYDGLYGFAHQFLYAADDPPTWPSELLAPSFGDRLGPWQQIRDRFGRIMWRTPSEPVGNAAPARWGEPAENGDPASESQLQPAPYFVIEAEHVDLVCIDTGIDGTIDERQFKWMNELGGGKPKILMTGKPLSSTVSAGRAPWPQVRVADPEPVRDRCAHAAARTQLEPAAEHPARRSPRPCPDRGRRSRRPT